LKARRAAKAAIVPKKAPVVPAKPPKAEPVAAEVKPPSEAVGEKAAIEVDTTRFSAGGIGLTVKKGGKLLTELTFSIDDEGIAKIGFIKAFGGRGSLSVADLREIQRQAKEEFPQIKKFVGDRVTKEAISTPSEAVPKAQVAKQPWEMTETNKMAADLGFTKSDQAVIAFIEARGGQVNLAGPELADWYTYKTPEGLIIQSDTEIVGKGGYAELRAKADEWD
jgi:hypothetical protein